MPNLKAVLEDALAWWVGAAQRASPWVVLLCLLAAGLAARYTAENLAINTDTADMISEDLPWRRHYIAYKQSFPQYVDTLLVVLEGSNPDLVDRASEAVADRLREEDELVRWVYRPGAGPYFERQGLLYLGVNELAELTDHLAAIQPFLGRLAGDPGLRGLFELLGDAVEAVAEGESLALGSTLEAIAGVVDATLHGRQEALSWRELMAGGTDALSDRRRFVIVKPRLDYTELFPAEAVIERVRSIGREAGLRDAQGVRLRLTGGIALAHEELKSVARGAGLAAAIALVLVGVILWVGLRSARLVLASLVTLLVGLLWTAAFATAAVGYLNLISVAFAVLYIGLGVAYAIHFSLRYRELLQAGLYHESALRETARDVGGSLVLCAATTGVGFYAFVPTDFAGVSELGLISGTGMFISLAATVTLLPALLSLRLPAMAPPLRPPAGAQTPLSVSSSALVWLPFRYRTPLLVSTAVLGVAALTALPAVRFDNNPLNLRDPTSESVRTYRDLLAGSETSPWSLVVMAADAEEAAAVKRRLASLETVDSTRSLRDFVPGNQDEKLRLIDDLELLLGPSLVPLGGGPPPDLEAQRAALEGLVRRLEAHLASGSAPVPGVVPLHAALVRLQEAVAQAGDGGRRLLERLEGNLVGTLPEQLRRLRRSLDAQPVDLADLPDDLVERWVAPDGRRRVEVFPAEDLTDEPALRRFVSEVRGVAPGATGSPLIILASGEAVVGAFREAFTYALVLITVLLFALMRTPRDVGLILTPLLLAGILTVAGMVVLGMPFNFANVIALPLLLGVGVDNGIHMVNRMRTAPPAAGNPLQTSTARAIVTSSLTTICSFGNLAFSAHRGTASMGQLLTLGLAFTLICTLVLLPVMLVSRSGEERRA